MPRKRRVHNTPEDKQLQAFIDAMPDDRQPRLRIYRLESDGSQTRLFAGALEEFPAEDAQPMLQDWFGAGKFLVRTVRSNGTYGPSRVFHIG